MARQRNDGQQRSVPLAREWTERDRTDEETRRDRRLRAPWLLVAIVVLVLALLGLAVRGLTLSRQTRTNPPATSSSNVDVGSALGGFPAASFTLTDQFGQSHQLSEFRGKVVALAFIDSRCTDTCPLTAETLRLAVGKLGSQSSQVQLLAVNANPLATSVKEVRTWSDAHEMTNRWLFLTGSADQLKPIWKAYGIEAEVEPNGDVAHTPAIYLIDRAGREQFLFLDGNDPGGVGAQASILAGDLTKLLAS